MGSARTRERELTVLSLCAGVGGLDLAIRLAVPRSRTVCFVERDAFAAACLAARMRDGILHNAPVWSDLRSFDGRPWRGCVDLVCAGFPCQPWSAAGKRQGTADERWLWPDIARILREVRPGFVFLENSPELVHGGLEHVLGTLAEIGLHAEWDVFAAADVGATHDRERLFLLAYAPGSRLEGGGA